MAKTSWSPVASWYDKTVGKDGHYYHRHVIFPGLETLFTPRIGESVLDVGCGQGVYARVLPPGVRYTGIDNSSTLLKLARQLDKNAGHRYILADATRTLPTSPASFDHVICILALQNMADAAAAIKNMGEAVKPGGDLILVLNHPAFRIPRQSGWGLDEGSKVEYRRENMYLSALKIPIVAHPGEKNSPVTWSYHHPLSHYVGALKAAGCAVTDLAEWVSDKQSVGVAGKRENKSRGEFPLFLAIRAVKYI